MNNTYLITALVVAIAIFSIIIRIDADAKPPSTQRKIELIARIVGGVMLALMFYAMTMVTPRMKIKKALPEPLRWTISIGGAVAVLAGSGALKRIK